jgi:hypothetical protein
MSVESVDLGFGGEPLPLGSHACWYYSGEDQLREALQFIRLGLEREGEFCALFADESRFDGLLSWLGEDMREEPEAFIESGQLALIGGAPTTVGLLDSIGARLDRAIQEGYRLIRFLGFIAWQSPGWPDDRSLLEFEARVNEVVTAYPAVIVCTYGVPTLLGPSLIYGGLQAHPISIIHGRMIRESPFYLTPAELVERRGKDRSSDVARASRTTRASAETHRAAELSS